MKRYGIFIILLFFITFMAAWMAGATSIIDSKHNLSSNASATQIRASGPEGATEVCVYCHTPHHAKSDPPLWNRTDSTATYQTYTSDVLAGLGYLPAEDPKGGEGVKQHVKTRICLSCHDGTIALGNLINYPYPYTDSIPMQGPNLTWDNKLANTAPGYIGTDLRDDHPVAIKYTSADPELNPIIGGNKVKVYYYDLGSGRVKPDNQVGNDRYVECTSCHNPHNNEFGKFLVETNQYSGLCKRCHTKYGYETFSSIHSQSTASYSPPTGGLSPYDTLGNNVGQVKCMDCHFPHKAGKDIPPSMTPQGDYGKYLLSYQKDNSCFNETNRWGQSVSVCHGTNATNYPGTKDIDVKSEMNNKFYAHNYTSSYGFMHDATEGQSFGWGSGKWHVECVDCHNPHTAGNNNGSPRTAGTNTIDANSPLYGAGGVRLTSNSSGWTAPTEINFQAFKPYGVINNDAMPADYAEYQICFKCHSAWGGGAPAGYTNQALEFKTNNGGFHPVVDVNPNRFQIPPASWNPALGFSSTGKTMYCSDCHGNNEASPQPQGPHGSSNSFILRYQSFMTSYSTNTSDDEPTGRICDQCHAAAVYYQSTNTPGSGFQTSVADGSINLHNSHKAKKKSFAYRCVNCHTKIPHGYHTRRGMIVVQGDVDEDKYSAGGGFNTSKITSFPIQPGVQSYPSTTNAGTCGTVVGCH